MQRGCAKGASCSLCHLCPEGEYKAKAGKRKGEAAEANDRIRKAFKHMDDHKPDKPGHATATSCSERSCIRVCCKDCGSASGTFKCNGCWDSEDEAVPAEEARIYIQVPNPFDYMLVGIDKSPPQRCRLRERNENDTWNIQFKDKTYANDIPGDKLEPDKDCVESLQELKTILGKIFKKLPPDSHGPGSSRRVMLRFLPQLVLEKFGKCLNPKALGHKKLCLVMAKPEMTEKFQVKGSYIYEAQPTCNNGLNE